MGDKARRVINVPDHFEEKIGFDFTIEGTNDSEPPTTTVTRTTATAPRTRHAMNAPAEKKVPRAVVSVEPGERSVRAEKEDKVLSLGWRRSSPPCRNGWGHDRYHAAGLST